MINLQTETLLPLNDVPNHIPSRRKGKRLNVATIHRWRMSGRLEVVRIGGGYYTTVEALSRFAEPSGGSARAREGKPSTSREKEIAAAEARLAKEGVA